MHESDDFWRENASRLNEKDHEQLKLVLRLKLPPEWALTTFFFRILVRLLSTEDPLVLAVAVHDLGKYVKHYERGKK